MISYQYRVARKLNSEMEFAVNDRAPDERLVSVSPLGVSGFMMLVFERAFEDPTWMPVAPGGPTGQEAVSDTPTKPGKSPEAVALGARGGRARAASLTAEQMSQIARMGVLAKSKRRKK